MAPLTEDIAHAVARLLDDAQVEPKRKPSHADLTALLDRVKLGTADPTRSGVSMGKHRRIRDVLLWALENDPPAGERLVGAILAQLRALGGFKDMSSNFCGAQAINNARTAFRRVGYELASDGDLRPRVLDSLSGQDLTDALREYVLRAQRGVLDAALLAGTAKDLIEATAAHVVVEIQGSPPVTRNFPTLLYSAYTALQLTAAQREATTPLQQLDAAMFQMALAVNALRNQGGTGHGRPFPSSVSPQDACTATQSIGVVAHHLLLRLEQAKRQRKAMSRRSGQG